MAHNPKPEVPQPGRVRNSGLELSGWCIYPQDTVSDTGWYIFEAGSLEADFRGLEERSCGARLVVRRMALGALDPAFGDGAITGVHGRTRSIWRDP